MSNKLKFYTIIFSVLISSILFFYMSINNINLKDINIINNYNVTPLSELKQNTNLNKYNNKSLEEMDKIILSEDMITVDLQNMKISLIQSGKVIKYFNIISKGKPGSYYETPAGNYQIKGKFGNKFSNLGQVYMPYAMQFYGNFFIHGIPYYPDGTRVATSYSGGCIRMSDADAKEIYEFAKENTKVLILNNSIVSDKESLDQGKTINAIKVLVSLEVLNQEKYVTFNNKKVQIKNLNKYILEDNIEAKNIILSQIGANNFEERKLEKMNAIGISDYNFEAEESRINLLNYIKANKSYVLSLL